VEVEIDLLLVLDLVDQVEEEQEVIHINQQLELEMPTLVEEVEAKVMLNFTAA
jgi:hypothetical protein